MAHQRYRGHRRDLPRWGVQAHQDRKTGHYRHDFAHEGRAKLHVLLTVLLWEYTKRVSYCQPGKVD